MLTPLHNVAARLVAGLIAAVLVIGSVAFAAVPAQAHPGAHVLIFTKTTQFRHTDAIDKGTPLIVAALAAEGIEATHTEDSTLFNDTELAKYDAVIMFQASGDPWNAEQKAALERYQQAGGGIVAIHNATDMRGNYPWWDQLVGSLMPGHAATGTDPGLRGTVRIEDDTHPSTEHFEESRWERSDEWYNFSNNVRGTAHVLASMDESTYDAGGNKMGYDHPISWCKPYDGGRAWATAMGHFGSHYQEPAFMQHIVGGVKYAAGVEQGDCGGTVWDSFEKVPLDQNTSAPFAMDIADDGRVFYTELVRGQVRMWDPATNDVTTVLELDVYSGGEDGLLGIALDPDFTENGRLYLYRSPDAPNNSDPSSFFSRVSRFTMENGVIDPATEELIIEVPARRLPDEPGHTGGGLDFDAQGNLYLGVGDDVNPHSEPSGGYAPLSTRPGTFHDARETSANTNDLRGKLLRITPKADGPGYTIPEGNLFDEAADAANKTLPEIYAMGFRNPFRFSVDQKTGAISLADYSPDNGTDAPATRGPAGIAEWNYITSPGNYGWPLCMGDNEPFRDVDYTTNPVTVGEFFDCASPINDSPRNTGLTELPAARGADMFYGYKRSSVPGIIPQGGGLAPMGGPVYNYDPALVSDTKFPASYDGKPFFYEWARNKMYSIQLKDPAASSGSQVEKVNAFLPQEQFLAPIDSRFGPDGSLYVLDWGGGFGRDNPNSGLHRIDYISGSRSPVAKATSDKDSGQAPLTVAFDGSASFDPENAALAYAWDFDGDGTVDATTAQASHTFASEGVFDARLTVTDPDGKTGTTTVPITVGNTRPDVAISLPPSGAFFDFGDDVSWAAQVTDPEDGTINGDDLIIQPALGHDEHAHPLTPLSGFTGTTATSLGGHAPDEDIFFAIDARYTDRGGAGGANPLTGSQTTLLYPKVKQAEFFDSASAGMKTGPSRDVEGIAGDLVITGGDGAWAHYDPVNFHRIDDLALRVSANTAGSSIELRKGAVDGELLATADVPATGSMRFTDVIVDVSAFPNETLDLYVVFRGGEIKLNFLEAIGRGASPVAAPTVAITAPQQDVQLEPGQDVTVAADAADTQGEVSKVEFFVDGVSIGADDSAPYSATWTAPEEGLYELTAVATNTGDKSKTSRIVLAQVGELFGDLVPFTNAEGTFERIGDGKFRINGAGDNTWQGTDEYSTLFAPAGGDDNWEAVVKIDAQENTNGSAKAGLIVRNDVTLPGTSPGYALVGIRPNGGVEFLTDPDGNGQLNASVAGGTTSYPTWVKLKRDASGYTAYFSKNGTSWTQVGGAVTLAGAAATQDVGMFMVSHSATEGTVDFADFAIDTDPAGPQPVEPLQPLACPTGPLSDEFDAPALAPSWALRSDPAKPITQSGGTLNLPVTTGDINEAATGPVSFAGKPLPAGAWEATTKITLAHTSHWQWAGLVVHQNDNEYNKLAFVRGQGGGRFIEFQSETAGSRTTPAAPALATDFPSTIHLKLTSNGTVLTGAYSADGQTWTALTGQLQLKQNARIGVMAAGDLGTTPVTAQVDWFRFSPEPAPGELVGPNDEFDGTALDGCRWDQSVRYDSNNAKVADGHLKITTQPGDINGANPISPRNFILTKAPEGDWVATTKFKAPLKHRWQLAGLLMWADDDNYVKADVVATNNPGTALNLKAEMAGEANGTGFGSRNIEIPDSSESGYWYIRVTKTGDQYTSEVSDGGVNWTPIGTSAITFDKPLRGLGLMAIGPQQEEPVVVEFDSFHLEQEVDDTTAPTTSLTWAPDAPDGENGWYRTAPKFTLAATDGDGSGVTSTEYAIGDGAWTAYDAPVELSGQGEVSVSYRSTDEAGNVEEKGTATVSVDTVAAATTATVEEVEGGVRVTLAAVDDTSGVAGTQYRLDGGEWAAYAEPILVTGAGDHTVDYRSTDKAGHVEVDQTATVTIGEDPGPVELKLTSAAASQCVDRIAQVAVYATNAGNVWADMRIDTPWGTHEVEKVAPGATVYHLFDTGSAKVKKGTATVTAFHSDGSRDYDATQKAAFAQVNCK
ncbi:ThuA domain-containing protein [Agromyces sp. SYSU K20354]|uniref:ThuA domain-containing protein n=1 Tax=Agromyces cavernae TaxID=2898659 RepID=UPI001E4F97CF|nr:ThuA domain-containing protein [Agromyces cavernae]MCD2440921.1 ThuA domain-containing protein [Agromyces cavernae]